MRNDLLCDIIWLTLWTYFCRLFLLQLQLLLVQQRVLMTGRYSLDEELYRFLHGMCLSVLASQAYNYWVYFTLNYIHLCILYWFYLKGKSIMYFTLDMTRERLWFINIYLWKCVFLISSEVKHTLPCSTGEMITLLKNY